MMFLGRALFKACHWCRILVVMLARSTMRSSLCRPRTFNVFKVKGD